MNWLLAVLLILLALFCATLVAIEIYYKFDPDRRIIDRIPGPETVPVLGNLQEILKPPVQVFQQFRKMAKQYYPVYKLSSCTAYISINIIAPEDMQTVLSNIKHIEKSILYSVLNEWLQDGLLTSTGDKWQLRRKILTPTFHFKILKKFVPILNRHSTEFTDELSQDKSKHIDILPHVHKCTLHMIAESAMGVRMEDKEREAKYRNAIHSMGDIIVYRVVRPWLYYRLAQMCTLDFYKERFLLRYLKNFTRRVIRERQSNFDESILTRVESDSDDFGIKRTRLAMLDLLISAQRRDEINDDGISEEVDTFMFEGHDTITMAINFCLMLLACNGDAQRKVYEELATIFGDSQREPSYDDLQEMNYMELAIKESLRIYPSVPLISRILGEDMVTSSGYKVPAGTLVILHIYDTHHNADIYPDPERFDPERFTKENSKDRHAYAYLPFSAGSRNCIGQKYAILSMKSMLAAVLRRFELLPVDTPETIELMIDIILRTKQGIKIKLKPRAK